MTGVPKIQDALVLESGDLLDKYGFGDGDMADEIVSQWAEQSWPGRMLGGEYVEDHPAYQFCNSRVLLGRAIRDRLVPVLKLPPGVHVTRQYGWHNPFYLVDSAGQYVEESTDPVAEAIARTVQSKKAPVVVVPPRALDQLCASSYPYRPEGWLHMFAGLTWLFDVKHTLTAPPEPIMRMDTYVVGAVVDVFAAGVHDDVLRLAGSMIESQYHDVLGDGLAAQEKLIADCLKAAAALVSPAGLPVTIPAFADARAAARPGILPRRAPAPPGVTVARPSRRSMRAPGRG